MGPKPKDPVPVIPDAMALPPMAALPGPIVAVDEKVQPAPPMTIYKPSESVAPLVEFPAFTSKIAIPGLNSSALSMSADSPGTDCSG